ncbi:ARM repeat-containing protein [Hesseltinella vesiculosa]|uniref:ARM repeat-containing protein n=1 Tax=Hesseltinella vesiculosa TaxID=101127 RepID=A0A1X2GFG8_9FUNG|nr:ARM repeat-containing protein [Hesseltinella vesiculosa]
MPPALRPRASSFQTPFVSTSGLFDPSSYITLPTSPTSESLLRADTNDTITITLASLGLDDLDKSHTLFRGNANFPPDTTPRRSRSLWIGHFPDAKLDHLTPLFTPFGAIESIVPLPDREAVLVHFYLVEDALRAMQSLLDGTLALPTSDLGFAHFDLSTSALPTRIVPVPCQTSSTVLSHAQPCHFSSTLDFVQEPTRALWIGNLPTAMNPTSLYSVFSFFGAIESVRILGHKNCGFVNFFLKDDAIRAKKAYHGKEILPGTGSIRIGYAKVQAVTSTKASSSSSSSSPSSSSSSSNTFIPPSTSLHHDDRSATDYQLYANTLSPHVWHNSTMYQPPPSSMYIERQQIMNELGEDATDGPFFDVVQPGNIVYATAIVPAPELGPHRALDTTRLREIKKRLEGDPHLPLQEVERMALECIPDLVELCSDFIGNTVVQRLFERCSEHTKNVLLERVAPHLASIGIHKNGTWAAQRIVDTAKTPLQISIVCESLKLFVPALLLDQFGNYVVQCCLSLGPHVNQFVFDAIVLHCWEIAQGRFGARAVRATLESPYVTKRQQKYVAATLIQNALLLATNANGALLLIWLLDTSALAGRYSVLASRLLPHLPKLCTHKLASLTVLKLVNQRQEPQARLLILNALFFNNTHRPAFGASPTSGDPSSPSVLYEVIMDQVHGVNLIQKILSSSYVDLIERQRMADKVKQLLAKHKLLHVQGYKRLLEEINMVMVDSNPGASLAASLPNLMLPPSTSPASASMYSPVIPTSIATFPSLTTCTANMPPVSGSAMAATSSDDAMAPATLASAPAWPYPDWTTLQAHCLSAAQAVFQQQQQQKPLSSPSQPKKDNDPTTESNTPSPL